jgi:class 3 adenylate cyclase/tetratricopeptide (TPR) repeat protein
MTEREQLEQAIAALEAQRAVLGDAVVDPATAGLRRQLAELEPTSAEQTRKQVTVLFADISGFTTMSEALDAEELGDTMSALWQRIDAVIVEHGGMIDKHIGDAVMALWGADEAREDDPERAIRAALAAQAELAAFREERDVQLAMRVGLNTGPVLLGEVRPGEFTAMGDTVNLASRMEHAAPVGGVLISHDTYRHVRGIFDVLPQDPLTVKGKAEPVQTYIIQQAKPRAFRMATRGVEGIETRMVGRDAELLILQNTFRDVMEDAEVRIVTVVGEAGVGKSRLLYEFDNWVELLPDQVHYFKGRATPEMQAIPYSIVRDMFAYRFDIRESDSAVTVLDKFRKGMDSVLNPDRADLVGHLVGFDFSTSEDVSGLLGSPSFGELAIAYLTHYMRATASEPTAIFLEDIHWADDSSLDLLDHLVTAMPNARLLIVCMARPLLFERRSNWGEGWAPYRRLDLKLLSRRDSRSLVNEILQKVEHVPDDLRDLVVDGAEGNPFYVEELIKMLIEDGVIVHMGERWHVEPDRLVHARVPPTLTGVLQARLDALPREERALLQRASVVGRLFWDAAVVELGVGDSDRIDRDEIVSLLDTVRDRELVFRRERSAFEGTDEYIFKHAILRDVTYETVLLKLRRVYHAQVARWLQANAGGRAGEYLSLIARHYELAGEQAKAADYLRRSGEELSKVGAFRDAISAFERVLTMLPESDLANSAALLVKLGNWHHRVGDFSVATQRFEEALTLARDPSGGDPRAAVAALNGLGWTVHAQGAHDAARRHLEKGLALAREHNDREGIAGALRIMSRIASTKEGDFEKAARCIVESLMLYRELGDRHGIAYGLRELGIATILQGEYEEARTHLEESLALNREFGDRRGIASVLNCLGENARKQAKYEEAVRYYEESLAISRELGLRWRIMTCLNNLGHVYVNLGEDDAAWGYLRESLTEAATVEASPKLETLVGVAGLEVRAGRHSWAAELLGLVLEHPALDEETRQYAEGMLITLRETLPADELEAALARGESLDYEAIIAEILEEAMR